MRPEHASLYLLELYPNAPLKEDMARAAGRRRPTMTPRTCTLEAMDRLEAAGY